MKRQARPFVVEVKRKRGGQRRERSIWGNIDLTAMAAETTVDLERNEQAKHRFIDSDSLSLDAESRNNMEGERHMADHEEAGSTESVIETPAGVEAAEPEKAEPRKRTPRQRKTKAQSGRPAEKNSARRAAKAAEAPAATIRTGRKIHSKQERAQKLGQIEKSVGRGETLKSAVRQAGISEQTYYQWKKAANSVAPAGDLKDLLALEEENKRLKKLLAERLRKENADLKKKLGLD